MRLDDIRSSESPPVARRRVAVCVATYKRPESLGRLLTALLLQIADLPDGFEAGVVVVDNDPSGSAGGVVRGFQVSRDVVDYVVEADPGIAAARNAAVRRCLDRDALVFIDDDESPRPGWLVELLRIQRLFDAPVVAGPVVARYDAVPPRWVEASGFFRRVERRTGSEVKWPATNNVLVSVAALPDSSPFDERFGLSGGSDTHLFMRLAKDGVRQVWAEDAVVEEVVPAARLSRSWVLRRSFRLGNSIARCERDVYGTNRVVGFRLLKGLANVGIGGLRMVAGCVRGDLDGAFVGTLASGRGLGMVAGLCGVTYREYKRPRSRELRFRWRGMSS